MFVLCILNKKPPFYKSPKNLVNLDQIQTKMFIYPYSSDILDTKLSYYHRVTATVQKMFLREETP